MIDARIKAQMDPIDTTLPAPEREPERQFYFMKKCREIIHAKEKELGRPLSADVVTFGCQMNARDSEKLLGILKEIGFEESDSEEADFVLYNTCTVRDNANQRVYGRLGHLHSMKKTHPDKLIALCGCMIQEETVVAKIRESYRFAGPDHRKPSRPVFSCHPA